MRGMRRSTSTEDPATGFDEPVSEARLDKLLEPGRVVCNAKARSRKHALEILSELLVSADIDLSQGEILEQLIARERLGRTGLPGGVAIPHARIEGINDNIAAFLKLNEPVEYDTPDGAAVDLILSVLLPADCSPDQAAEVRALTHIPSDPEFLQRLRKTKSSRALYELLVAYPELPADYEHQD